MIFGAILGPIALGLLFAAPPGRCWACHSQVGGWNTICLWCGNDVTADPSRARVLVEPTAPVMPADVPTALAPVAGTPTFVRVPAPNETTTTSAPTTMPVARSGSDRVGAAETSAELAGPPPVRPLAVVPSEPAVPSDVRRTLATGVFVTGTVGLRPGSRYLITILGERLQVLGPAEENPTAVVFDRPVADMDATGFNERLIINQAGHARGNIVLVFMALGGGRPEAVADAIAGGPAFGARSAS